MKRALVIAALCVAAALAIAGCSDDSSPAPGRDAPATFDDAPPSPRGTEKSSFSALDAAAATALAEEFIRPYGTFTPAAPNPGRTWLSSWEKLADKAVAERATANFDALWGWTWDQQVQAQDVQQLAPPSVTDTGFGTLAIRIPAKRYVIGLLAHRMTDGYWQRLDFDVIIGPKTPGSADNGLTVYKVDFTVAGGA